MSNPHPIGGNGGIISDLMSKDLEYLRRLKTQSLSVGEQYIVDGVGFTSHWREDDVNNTDIVYAEFVVPTGFYMALDYRSIKTSAEKTIYRVFPEGTYTVGADKTDTALSFARTENLRRDSTFIQDPIRRVNVTSAPALTDFIVFVDVFGESGSGSGNKAIGELDPDDTYILIPPESKFLQSIQNNGAGNEKVNVTLNYAFIPESEITPPVI